jgi:hypothetical protein
VAALAHMFQNEAILFIHFSARFTVQVIQIAIRIIRIDMLIPVN